MFLKNPAYKSAIAVSTVVFGTIAMFLYPFLFKLGILDLSDANMGIYIGATFTWKVAHVVGAGQSLGEDVSQNAVIVKMIRVMMLAPFLIILSIWLLKTAANSTMKMAQK